jgi:glycerophosphoryl diester phosphodiesterase
MIKVCAHRGLWSQKREQNSINSLMVAQSKGYALEIDLHLYKNKLWVTHDGPLKDPFAYLLSELMPKIAEGTFVFWDLKGAHDPLLLESFFKDRKNYYLNNLDPKTQKKCKKLGLQCLNSINEKTQKIPQKHQDFLLIDFQGKESLMNYLTEFNPISSLEFFISREIFNEKPNYLWDELRTRKNSNLFICTDHCESLSEYIK